MTQSETRRAEALPSLDIILVNWNSGDQLRTCLASITAARSETFEIRRVVVVDNGSTDSSLEGITSLDLPLTVLCNQRNLGFGAACNQGASLSEAEFLLFLNPDARLFPQSLSVPLGFMRAPGSERIGVCGIQLLDDTAEPSRTCCRFPSPRHLMWKSLGLDRLWPARYPPFFMHEWDHASSRQVDHVIGAFYLIRRTVFAELQGFDERFFMYLEDLDLSYRVQSAGWSAYYLADAQAYHKGGGTSERIKATRLFYSLRSRLQYAQKHFGGAAYCFISLATLLLEPWIRIGHALRSGSIQSVQETLGGYAKLWISLATR